MPESHTEILFARDSDKETKNKHKHRTRIQKQRWTDISHVNNIFTSVQNKEEDIIANDPLITDEAPKRVCVCVGRGVEGGRGGNKPCNTRTSQPTAKGSLERLIAR